MSETICELKIKLYCAIAQPVLLFRAPGCIVFNILLPKNFSRAQQFRLSLLCHTVFSYLLDYCDVDISVKLMACLIVQEVVC